MAWHEMEAIPGNPEVDPLPEPWHAGEEKERVERPEQRDAAGDPADGPETGEGFFAVRGQHVHLGDHASGVEVGRVRWDSGSVAAIVELESTEPIETFD
jgi:hypothetical protein